MQSIKDDFKKFNKELMPHEVVVKTGYGYQLDNPIRVKSVQGEYRFIHSIIPNNPKAIMYLLKDIRLMGSEESEVVGSIVDHFEVLFREYTETNYIFKIYDLYFCAYKDNNKSYPAVEQAMSSLGQDVDSIRLPEGFKLRTNEDNDL